MDCVILMPNFSLSSRPPSNQINSFSFTAGLRLMSYVRQKEQWALIRNTLCVYRISDVWRLWEDDRLRLDFTHRHGWPTLLQPNGPLTPVEPFRIMLCCHLLLYIPNTRVGWGCNDCNRGNRELFSESSQCASLTTAALCSLTGKLKHYCTMLHTGNDATSSQH